MSVCKLKDLNDKTVKGTTLITVTDDPKDAAGDCIRPTIIYLPKKTVKPPLNVILWMHGFYVKDYSTNLFGKDETGHTNKLRESVDNSGEDVILIAPWCGYKYAGGGSLGLGDLASGQSNVQKYLDKILGLIAQQPGVGTAALDSKSVDRFVLACHSGGGTLMRQITGVLGPDLGKKLKECWGFDCMYESGHEYACWADSIPSLLGSDTSFYFYLANGTLEVQDKKGVVHEVWPYFLEFWRFAYGTPDKPETQRMQNVFLAPALDNPQKLETLSDDVVFQSSEAISEKQRKLKASSGDQQQPQAPLLPYEEFRLKLDLAINEPKPKQVTNWGDQVRNRLKSHYGWVQDLLAPRIKGMFRKTKPASGANIIAQIHRDRCVEEIKREEERRKRLERGRK
jgi:hypothetical protein